MDSEIDIVEIIKSRRYFNMAIRKLLPHKDRMEIKERSRYIMVDPDSDKEVVKLDE